MINVVCRYETGLAYSFRFYDPISIDAIRNKYCKECGNNCEDGLCPVA
ncbi:hypothetical protein OESDEN_17018 [Oesophagostomum dentatum]|uniref:4Fe-4S ferredoxin-type domain-containing protein n=1 Tax=Oesophagostomum dentatum TaxID=61180 RepID=A0A0B1SJ96_OESDE|nr:hypothetical protein OESDEN_17018 [Oesophagostomum dentatum]